MKKSIKLSIKSKLYERCLKLYWELLNIPSQSQHESKIGLFLSKWFKKKQFTCNIIKHNKKSHSIYAYNQHPSIIYSTHLDTLLPWQAPFKKGKRIYGIGACDAKICLAAQSICADYLNSLHKPIGLLFLAGEESDSKGAKHFYHNPLQKVEYIIHGEPTGAKQAKLSFGVVEVELIARAKAYHSATNAFYNSAIWKLFKKIEIIQDYCKKNKYILNISNLKSENTPSITAEKASVNIQIRSPEKYASILQFIQKKIKSKDIGYNILYISDYQKYYRIPGYDSVIVPFATDASNFQSNYKHLLLGIGDISRAHRQDEYIKTNEIMKAIQLYLDFYFKLEEKILK